MAKILKCPSCQEKIDVTDLSGGSTVQCQACGTMVRIATGTTGKVPQAAPPPPPPPPAPARKGNTTKMRKKERGTSRVGPSPAPGRQTDLFRKMSNARSPGEGGRPRGGGGEKKQGGNNSGMIIAIAAAAVVVIAGVAFAVMHKSEPEPAKASTGKESAGGAKKKKKDEAAAPKPPPTPAAPSEADTFKPGARAMAGVGKDVLDMKCNPDAKQTFEGMVTSGKVADVVAADHTWITYIIDGLLSDNEAVAKGSMDALHQIINKRKLDARMSDLAKKPVIGGFNMPEMRSGEYTYWAQWWFTKSARDAVAGWAEAAGGSSGGADPAAPRVAAGNPATESWEETLRKCRSGGFHNSSNPEYYEFQRIKGMGKSAYPHLVRFIDHEDTSLGTTAVLILKELSGRSEQPSRVTEANKAKIKEDWEGWLRSGP
jgi:hypothetical protein